MGLGITALHFTLYTSIDRSKKYIDLMYNHAVLLLQSYLFLPACLVVRHCRTTPESGALQVEEEAIDRVVAVLPQKKNSLLVVLPKEEVVVIYERTPYHQNMVSGAGRRSSRDLRF